jgi:hypothetical protein
MTTESTTKRLLAVKNPRVKVMHEQGLMAPIDLAKAMEVRPQMIYNRIRDNKLPAHFNTTGKYQLRFDDAVDFADAYFTRAAEKKAKIDAELAGEKA